jgi:hypothetical protein
LKCTKFPNPLKEPDMNTYLSFLEAESPLFDDNPGPYKLYAQLQDLNEVSFFLIHYFSYMHTLNVCFLNLTKLKTLKKQNS